MSYSISALLNRNLHEIFGENDAERRRAAIDEIFTEDCVFYDPMGGVYRGREGIDRVAGAVRATHPDFRYQPKAEPEEVGNSGRVQWVEGRPGDHCRSRSSNQRCCHVPLKAGHIRGLRRSLLEAGCELGRPVSPGRIRVPRVGNAGKERVRVRVRRKKFRADRVADRRQLLFECSPRRALGLVP
jgi:SnoaL-like protein